MAHENDAILAPASSYCFFELLLHTIYGVFTRGRILVTNIYFHCHLE